MNIRVNVRMSKIMRAPIKVVVPSCATYVTSRTQKYLKSDCGTTFEVLKFYLFFILFNPFSSGKFKNSIFENLKF